MKIFSLKDVKAPKIKEISDMVEKHFDLKNDERARLVFKAGGPELTFMTIADCNGNLTKEALEDLFMIDERPDAVVLLGNNTDEDVIKTIEFFSSNYYGYGGIVSENMKILGTEGHGKFSNDILDVKNNVLFYKHLMFDVSDEEDDEVFDRDVLLSDNRPEWVTASIPDRYAEYIKESRMKLLLHAGLNDRSVKYSERFGCFIKSCSGIEIFTIKI